MKWLRAMAGCGALFVAGCGSLPVEETKTLDAGWQREAIAARAELIFTNAVLFKPRETLPPADLAVTFAPLLIQEVAEANAISNGGPATMYYQLGAVQLGGITRPQMTYLWPFGKGKACRHGVRVTLDSGGFPVIWEILGSKHGPQVVVVSRSLEEKAKAAFGAPLPGRRFAVEQPVAVSPDVVVARVIEDGPVAMGPIVHQTADGEINAVICRCMPTQARQLVGTRHYELQALANDTMQIPGVNRSVSESLRLPPTF